MALLGSLLIVFGFASPAHADPSCKQGGAYVLFARGSGEELSGDRADKFQEFVMQALANAGIQNSWGELGNLDGDFDTQGHHDAGEYAAVAVDGWNGINVASGAYAWSVHFGVQELVTHLNHRYGSETGNWVSGCDRETLVLGGYSQGAHVIGDALRSGNLSYEARRHIGYVALYGDPKFNPGALNDRQYRANFQSNWWWVRGDDPGYRYVANVPEQIEIFPNSGMLGGASPYVPPEFKGRFGSWCAAGDRICAGAGSGDIHSNAYDDGGLIQRSADEIARQAWLKRNQLDTGGNSALPLYLASAMPYRYIMRLPLMQWYFDTVGLSYREPVIPAIAQIERTTDHVGTYQVYASTISTVTEAWWRPGQGVQTKEMIHISQDNIVGFDKVNEPDGTTQSLYTAVPDGVWETWWRPGEGPHSTKIVTGLTGVRQIIANPVTDGGQYTHRLYVLASDGPYEVWWREDGDGIHVNRLDIVNDPVTMTKSRGPDGTDQLYVATPTWVYELWWRPNTAVNHGSVINITQGDIRSLDKGANLPDGGQLLYTGTSTTGWQTYWNSANGTGISHGTIATGQSNAIQVKKTVYDGTHQLYLATGDHVQEYWWNGPNNGTSTLINISQNNITSFDKSADGPDQQLYTASGDLVYETWWRGGSNPSGPNTSVLFKVAR
jgi:hypothetical protein